MPSAADHSEKLTGDHHRSRGQNGDGWFQGNHARAVGDGDDVFAGHSAGEDHGAGDGGAQELTAGRGEVDPAMAGSVLGCGADEGGDDPDGSDGGNLDGGGGEQEEGGEQGHAATAPCPAGRVAVVGPFVDRR